MLKFYYKPTCPYCQRVLAANEQIGADLTLLDVRADVALIEELVALGGKRQTPFLHDTDRNVMMYESVDIIEYLRQQYGSGEVVSVPEVGNVCPID